MPSGSVTPAGAAFNGGPVTPAAPGVGMTITPANPLASGSDTTALLLVVPESAAPNFPNIYGLRINDGSGHDVFVVDSSGAVTIRAQPFEQPLTVIAATSNPTAEVALFRNSSNATTLSVQNDGQVVAPLLPTSDPHQAGSIYSVLGTLHVSSG